MANDKVTLDLLKARVMENGLELLRQLRERAETLGFELSTATDCECAIYEAQSDHRVTFGTLAEVDEWLRENGPTYRLGSAQNCLYGIQALCDAQEEFNASLVGIVEREARLALAALERVERVLRGLQ